MAWHRYRGRATCSLCGRSSPCMFADDPPALWCMRVQSDRMMPLGGIHGYFHGVESAAAPRSRPARVELRPHAVPLAPIERRDRIYRELAALLQLTADHTQHLLDVRGLPVEAIERYASVTGFDDLVELASAIARRVGQPVAGVPGFYRAGNRWRLVNLPTGILIPVPDAHGRIQAFELRADRPIDADHRYRPLTSNPAANREWRGGASPGKPTAVWKHRLLRTTRRWWIVEGVLKSCIAAHKLDAPTFGMQGVSSWRQALDLILELADGDRPGLVLAHDQDWRTNLQVWGARDDLAREARHRGFPVLSAEWQRQQRGQLEDGTDVVVDCKGLDDALSAGVTVDVVPWWREAPRAVDPRPRLALEKAAAAASVGRQESHL